GDGRLCASAGELYLANRRGLVDRLSGLSRLQCPGLYQTGRAGKGEGRIRDCHGGRDRRLSDQLASENRSTLSSPRTWRRRSNIAFAASGFSGAASATSSAMVMAGSVLMRRRGSRLLRLPGSSENMLLSAPST